jgi:hypothetical protein
MPALFTLGGLAIARMVSPGNEPLGEAPAITLTSAVYPGAAAPLYETWIAPESDVASAALGLTVCSDCDDGVCMCHTEWLSRASVQLFAPKRLKNEWGMPPIHYLERLTRTHC